MSGVDGVLPIGTRVRMLENRGYWKAGDERTLVSCGDWGDPGSSLDAGGDYWFGGIGTGPRMICCAPHDFEVIGADADFIAAMSAGIPPLTQPDPIAADEAAEGVCALPELSDSEMAEGHITEERR